MASVSTRTPVPVHLLNVQEIQDDKYTLPRDDVERERLEAQHDYLKELLGGRLIIDKDVRLEGGSRILDSGTGAASWILDVLKATEKSIEATGFDISTNMFPRNAPKNVKLYEMSCLNLPATWDNSFDLVNQRLLLAAFTEAQWLTVLSELFRVLKPGGSIQLTEVATLALPDGGDLPPATRKAIDYSLAIFKKHDIVGYEIGLRLPAMLEKVGFTGIRKEDLRAPLGKSWGDIGLRGSRNWAPLYRIFGAMCMREGGLGKCESLAEVDTVVDTAIQEWDENPGFFCHLYAITARKPM